MSPGDARQIVALTRRLSDSMAELRACRAELSTVIVALDRERQLLAGLEQHRAGERARVEDRANAMVARELAARDLQLRQRDAELAVLRGALHRIPHGGYLTREEAIDVLLEGQVAASDAY
jgi:hypothetical protein